MRFNPLPPPKRGETPKLRAKGGQHEVSIHSPRRSEGRQHPACRHPPASEFQSTPPAEARGDTRTPALPTGWKVFQSTPPAEARGDIYEARKWPRVNECFNPLPPPKRGETTCADVVADARRVSIPLPPPKRGETSRNRPYDRPYDRFQSTPPAEARGDDC